MTASEAPVILARARQGDNDAFRALVERHSRSAFRLAFRMTGNEQDAEDVVQESFLRAYRHLGRFEARADFGMWLYRIVANSLGVMSASRAGEALWTLYASESSPEVKKEIINALFVQRNATTLVDLARAEKDGAIKREIVSKLSVMVSKDAPDYLIELLR